MRPCECSHTGIGVFGCWFYQFESHGVSVSAAVVIVVGFGCCWSATAVVLRLDCSKLSMCIVSQFPTDLISSSAYFCSRLLTFLGTFIVIDTESDCALGVVLAIFMLLYCGVCAMRGSILLRFGRVGQAIWRMRCEWSMSRV